MPMTLDDVHAWVMALPGVTVGTRWDNKTWLVNEHGFAWQRPLTKADLGRLGDAPRPVGDLVAVRTESLDAKDALLALELPGFFTIQHFNGYPAVLIELRRARAADVRAALRDAFAAMAARPAKRPRKVKSSTAVSGAGSAKSAKSGAKSTKSAKSAGAKSRTKSAVSAKSGKSGKSAKSAKSAGAKSRTKSAVSANSGNSGKSPRA